MVWQYLAMKFSIGPALLAISHGETCNPSKSGYIIYAFCEGILIDLLSVYFVMFECQR